MAKIATYPIDSIPTLNDKVIGTNVDDENITLNYKISDICGLGVASLNTLTGPLNIVGSGGTQIAASGNTPFTCRVLEKAKNQNALTIAISNNHNGKILKYGSHKIILDTKAEVIAGSTRLKAGTAQKICLNVISSMVMVKMGRVKNGVMNEMVPTNEKLRLRKKNLINFIN